MNILIFNSSYPEVKCGIGDFTSKLAESIGKYLNYSVAVVTSKTDIIKPQTQRKLKVMPIVKVWTRLNFLKILPSINYEYFPIVFTNYLEVTVAVVFLVLAILLFIK